MADEKTSGIQIIWDKALLLLSASVINLFIWLIIWTVYQDYTLTKKLISLTKGELSKNDVRSICQAVNSHPQIRSEIKSLVVLGSRKVMVYTNGNTDWMSISERSLSVTLNFDENDWKVVDYSGYEYQLGKYDPYDMGK